MSSADAPPASDAPHLAALGAVSLERRLPLLMTGVLAAGLAAMLAVTYGFLERRTEGLVRQRLKSTLGQLATSAATSLGERATLLRTAAGDPAVGRVLAGAAAPGDLAAARLALAPLRDARDSTLHAELWDARGRVVAALGPVPVRAVRPVPAAPPRADRAHPDTVIVGPLAREGGRTVFWMIAPVRAGDASAGDAVAGWVALRRQVAGRADASRMLSDLTGEQVEYHLRNADGSVWVTGDGRVVGVPLRRDSTGRGARLQWKGTGTVLVADQPVPGTPLVVSLETPERAVRAALRSTMAPLLVLALGVVAGGAVVSWVLGRRITRPLTRLTGAAESLARGTYEHPIVAGAQDEVGRLAVSFDAMARQVVAARTELERRADDAQAAADALTRTNGQLRQAMLEAERARSEADRANRAKSDFLAMMSHELRTPLNAIGGYAELIEMGIHGPVTDAQREALLRIGRSQTHLLTLITDLLDFARIDAGQLRYAMDDVPLHEALAELESLVAPQLRERRLRFAYRLADPALAVRADGDKLRQLVLNLLGNAIKYTPEGGAVSLACEADGERVHVRVRDTGVGIAADRLPLIFEPFVQGERALNRPAEGVGLGLAISRELAHGMGGTLAVESEVGRGSVFTLTLRRAAAPASPPAPRAARTTATALA